MACGKVKPRVSFRRVRTWVAGWNRELGLRAKFMGIVLVLVFLSGFAATVEIRSNMRETMQNELQDRGISMARDIAARSVDLILTNNQFALHALLEETLANNNDILYAFIEGPRGEILAHTFEGGFPADLMGINTPGPSERFTKELLDTEEGLVYDIGVPVFEGKAGIVRVGMSEKRLKATLAGITTRLMLSTGIVSLLGLLVAFLMTSFLARPIRQLVEVTAQVAAGDLGKRAPVGPGGEVGRLSRAFNSMVQSLEALMNERDRFNQMMLRRTEELTVLNDVAAAIIASEEIEKVLHLALEKVVASTGFDCGEIYEADRGPVKPVLRRQLCPGPATEKHGNIPGSEAVCDEVIRTGQTLFVSPDEAPGRTVVGVPLTARTGVVGAMILQDVDGKVSAGGLDFLVSVGRYLGIAIENANLLRELRRKEAARSELLEKVIQAQEEERKRIARELHDETGQALTSLMVGITMLEGASDLNEVKEQVSRLRHLSVKILEEVRKLALELRPSVLDDLGLIPALRRYINDYQRNTELVVDLHIAGFDGLRLPSPVETAMYRVIQEALTNVKRHAGASNVSVLIERRGRLLSVIVEDDGCGFDVEEVMVPGPNSRLGLFGMEERVSLLGGRLEIESQPGAGTTLYVKIPVEAGEAEGLGENTAAGG